VNLSLSGIIPSKNFNPHMDKVWPLIHNVATGDLRAKKDLEDILSTAQDIRSWRQGHPQCLSEKQKCNFILGGSPQKMHPLEYQYLVKRHRMQLVPQN
jgi:hypothetical protein